MLSSRIFRTLAFLALKLEAPSSLSSDYDEVVVILTFTCQLDKQASVKYIDLVLGLL